jgi:hypothetical protein
MRLLILHDSSDFGGHELYLGSRPDCSPGRLSTRSCWSMPGEPAFRRSPGTYDNAWFEVHLGSRKGRRTLYRTVFWPVTPGPCER